MRAIRNYVEDLGRRARAAAAALARLSTEAKNAALLAMAEAVVREAASLEAANRLDLEAAERAGVSPRSYWAW